MKLDVVLSPNLLPKRFEDTLCAVIDVLRATTTVITALANGAREVRPCMDAAEARYEAESSNSGHYLLGGEEKGKRIPGFHLGNSPVEYLDSNIISDKIIYFATTNGTPALRKVYTGSGNPVYIAALVNLSAVSSVLVKAIVSNSYRNLLLLCSGRYGGPSLEDLFCAGLVLQKVRHGLLQTGISHKLSDGALIALDFSEMNENKSFDVLTAGEHGQYLQHIGFAADLEFASRIDTYQIVPIFDGVRIVKSQK